MRLINERNRRNTLHENDNENKCKDIKREETQKLRMNLSVGRELITDVIVTDTSGKTTTK